MILFSNIFYQAREIEIYQCFLKKGKNKKASKIQSLGLNKFLMFLHLFPSKWVSAVDSALFRPRYTDASVYSI